MSLIRINRNPSRRHLAIFAVGWLLSLGLVGWLFPLHIGDVSLQALCWVLAVVVPCVGLAVPGFLRWTYLASAYAAWPIGIVVSYVVLAVIYYGVLTPIGLILRSRGYDPLQRRFEPDADTYWIERTPPTEPERYFRQFQSPPYLPRHPTAHQQDHLVSDENQNQADQTDNFQRQADEAQPGLLWEFVDFLRYNKKWWLVPILLTIALFGLLVFLSSTTALPWIYAIF